LTDCFKNDPASHRFPDIEGQRRETIETETVRQNDTEAGELVQNQGESSITESRCTDEFELNACNTRPRCNWSVVRNSL
jgi:hypothetical protein